MTRLFSLAIALLIYFCGTVPFSFAVLKKNIIETADAFIGTPYRTGGKSPKGFDCSGFTQFVLENNDIKVSRSSCTQINDGSPIPLEAVEPGDILIFKGSNKNSNRAGHSAIAHHWENGVLYFIHSSFGKGIAIDNLNDPYYKSRFLQARNVMGNHKSLKS